MEKDLIVQRIIAELSAALESFAKAARASHFEATHEQSKAESKYDTRGLEASYLARGQSRQYADTEQAIKQFEALPILAFDAKTPIDLSAVVELEGKREKLFYFLGPRGGGTEITHDGKEIMVITPQSPLGQQLIGKKRGDRLKLDIGGQKNDYKIVSVH